MRLRSTLYILIFLCPISIWGNASYNLPKDLDKIFGPYSGCFLIKEVGSKEIKSYNREQCQKRWTPNSTFKNFKLTHWFRDKSY